MVAYSRKGYPGAVWEFKVVLGVSADLYPSDTHILRAKN